MFAQQLAGVVGDSLGAGVSIPATVALHLKRRAVEFQWYKRGVHPE
jgi:hypothetical protein